MMPATMRIAIIARALARLKRHYADGAPVPGRGRPLVWAEYLRLVAHVLAEHREES